MLIGLISVNEDLLKKIDARGRYQLDLGAIEGTLEVLIRTSGRVTPEQQSQLLSSGCRPHAIVGNVLSATIRDANSVEKVAALPFVRRIEFSKTLYQEDKPLIKY